MVLSFATLASVAVLIVVLSTTITYLSVITLNLPFLGVLAAMVVVGVLNAVLRRTFITNFEEVRKDHPATATRPLQATNATSTEVGFLFVAYLIVAIAQMFILRSRFTLHERTTIVAVTGISNAIFRSLL